MEIILFVFGCIGASHIIIEGKIFESTRNWLKKILPPFLYFVFECYQCAGVYCGLVCGWLVFDSASWWQLIACGFAGSFLSAIGALILNYLEAKTIVDMGENDG